MQTFNQILVVIVPEEIKDNLIDQLMALDFISGFSLGQIDGYSRAHSHYSINEQVEGYRKLYRFEVLHQENQEAQILGALKATCSKIKARYWILPVTSMGHFLG